MLALLVATAVLCIVWYGQDVQAGALLLSCQHGKMRFQ